MIVLLNTHACLVFYLHATHTNDTKTFPDSKQILAHIKWNGQGEVPARRCYY
jgi:hypothetical protein